MGAIDLAREVAFYGKARTGCAQHVCISNGVIVGNACVTTLLFSALISLGKNEIWSRRAGICGLVLVLGLDFEFMRRLV